MKEAAVLKRARLIASQAGCRLWRNNVGVFRTADGRVVRTGLCVGSSDLIGYRPITVGDRTIAQFMAVECKGAGGVLRPKQNEFLDFVNSHGGLGLAVWSPDELAEALMKELEKQQ